MPLSAPYAAPQTSAAPPRVINLIIAFRPSCIFSSISSSTSYLSKLTRDTTARLLRPRHLKHPALLGDFRKFLSNWAVNLDHHHRRTLAGPHKGEVRVSQELLKVFGPQAMLPQKDIEGVIKWIMQRVQDTDSF